MIPLNFGKVGVFVDGENIRNALENLGWKIDNEKLLLWILGKTKCDTVKPYFYLKAEDEVSDSKKRFLENLKSLEVTIINVPVEPKFAQGGKLINICDADPMIITDMMDWKDEFDKVMLLSGDGAFARPLERLWQHGKKVYVISTSQVVSRKLKDNPNFNFTDLNDIRKFVELTFI